MPVAFANRSNVEKLGLAPSAKPKAGFTHFRRAAATPFNLIFEVRR